MFLGRRHSSSSGGGGSGGGSVGGDDGGGDGKELPYRIPLFFCSPLFYFLLSSFLLSYLCHSLMLVFFIQRDDVAAVVVVVAMMAMVKSCPIISPFFSALLYITFCSPVFYFFIFAILSCSCFLFRETM